MESADPSPDIHMLVQACEGDRAAAESLVGRLYPLIARIVQAHLPRHEAPEDLTQEVFLKLFSRAGQFRGQVPLEHWVSRIAVTTCLDRLRARRRRPVVLWSDLSPAEKETAAMLVEIHVDSPCSPAEARNLLAKLMEGLAPAERALITWLDLEEKSISEVRELTGWSSGVVRIRAYRARRKLRALCARFESPPDPDPNSSGQN